MAQATDETTAAAPPGEASVTGRATGPLRRDPKTGRLLPRMAERNEPPDMDEAEELEIFDETAPLSPESPDSDEDVSDPSEPPDYAEAEEDETPEEPQRALARATGTAKVQALLTEALRLGQAYGLIHKQPDGTLVLPGQQVKRRDTSDCTCDQCHPWAQLHWWCVVCGSGPHDWFLVKPQFERQTLKPGGIEGARQAACSAQCARDYLASVGRQPSGTVAPGKEIDPTLGLPGS